MGGTVAVSTSVVTKKTAVSKNPKPTKTASVGHSFFNAKLNLDGFGDGAFVIECILAQSQYTKKAVSG